MLFCCDNGHNLPINVILLQHVDIVFEPYDVCWGVSPIVVVVKMEIYCALIWYKLVYSKEGLYTILGRFWWLFFIQNRVIFNHLQVAYLTTFNKVEILHDWI